MPSRTGPLLSEARVMTITHSTVGVASERRGENTVECPLCSTRLRRNDEPDGTEPGVDSLTTVARHRCVPRVKSRRE